MSNKEIETKAENNENQNRAPERRSHNPFASMDWKELRQAQSDIAGKSKENMPPLTELSLFDSDGRDGEPEGTGDEASATGQKDKEETSNTSEKAPGEVKAITIDAPNGGGNDGPMEAVPQRQEDAF